MSNNDYPKQVSTERGLIYVVGKLSREEALKKNYYYAFSSRKIGSDLYSKSLDELGYYHEFVIVK